MKNHRLLIYQITFLLFISDQIIKIIVRHFMHIYQEIRIIPNFFSLLYLKNTGAAFSILENNTLLLIIIGGIVIILLNSYIKKEKYFSLLGAISLGMIMGGIFGNLLDRIIYKAVIDYLSFTIFNYSFPVFNIADIGITVGASLFLLSSLLDKKRWR